MNIVISDEVQRRLSEAIAPRRRSRFIESAICDQLDLRERHKAIQQLIEAGKSMPVVKTDELVESIRQDRAR